MPIPQAVRAGAWTQRRVEQEPGPRGALTHVARQALRRGARAGLEALLREAPRLTGASEAALYRGRARVAVAGAGPSGLPPRLPRTMPPGLTGVAAPDGRTLLVLRGERPSAPACPSLEALAALGATLLAAQAREREAQARQAHLLRERQRLQATVAHLERQRRRASHDLRTPLLVIQGYVGMMLKGAAGPLTPAMQRYLEQVLKVSADQATLIEYRLAAEDAPEDLCALLRATFGGPSRRVPVRLALGAPVAPVRGARPALQALVGALARVLTATGAPEADLALEAAQGPHPWRLRLCARARRPRPTRASALLERLVRRLGGRLRVRTHPQWVLTLELPSARPAP